MCERADLVGRLAEVVDALQEVNPDAVETARLGGLVAELVRQVNRLQATELSWTGSFARRDGARAAGFRDTAGWLQATLRRRPGQARQTARAARLLADQQLPETRAALAAGDISADHALEVARAAEALTQAGADVAARPGLEARLVATARSGDAGRVRQAGRRLVQQVDADAAAAEARHAYRRRTLTLRDDRAGTIWVEGRLHQLGGETLATALNALAAPAGRHDHRTPGQRRADALVELACRAMRCKTLPDDGGLASGRGHGLGPAGDNATSIAGGGSVST